DADTRDKLTALTGIGVQAGVANNIISEVNGGRIGAALSVFQTASNWSEVNDGQRVAATIQTAESVFTALGGSSGASAASAGATSVGGSLFSGLSGLAGLFLGVDQAADVLK